MTPVKAVVFTVQAFFDVQIPKMAQKLVCLSKHVQNNCFYSSWHGRRERFGNKYVFPLRQLALRAHGASLPLRSYATDISTKISPSFFPILFFSLLFSSFFFLFFFLFLFSGLGSKIKLNVYSNQILCADSFN